MTNIEVKRQYHENGRLREEEYYQEGKLYDPGNGEPAYRRWHENGQLREEAYCQEGKLYDPGNGEPAYRRWHENGQLSMEAYYPEGKLHDPEPGVPAYRRWHEDGQLWEEIYYQYGETRHKEDALFEAGLAREWTDHFRELVKTREELHGQKKTAMTRRLKRMQSLAGQFKKEGVHT